MRGFGNSEVTQFFSTTQLHGELKPVTIDRPDEAVLDGRYHGDASKAFQVIMLYHKRYRNKRHLPEYM